MHNIAPHGRIVLLTLSLYELFIATEKLVRHLCDKGPHVARGQTVRSGVIGNRIRIGILISFRITRIEKK